MPWWVASLVRGIVTGAIAVVVWFLPPKETVMRKPAAVKVITCVSHGCELWNGRPLTTDEIRALKRVHALQHRVTNVYIRDIIGEQESK